MAHIESTSSCAVGFLTGVTNGTTQREVKRLISGERDPLTLAITTPYEKKAERTLRAQGFTVVRTGIYNPNSGRKVKLWLKVQNFRPTNNERI